MASCTMKENAEGGGKWAASRLGRFIPGKEPKGRAKEEAVWATEPVWMFWRVEKFIAPAGKRNLDPQTHGLVIILTILIRLQ